MKKQFIAIKQAGLVPDMQFVFCNKQDTAEAIAHRLTTGEKVVRQYCWNPGDYEEKDNEKWAVVFHNHHIWVAVPTREVRPGQWYAGVWPREGNAWSVAREFTRHGKAEGYREGAGPIEDKGWVVVNVVDVVDPRPMPGSVKDLEQARILGVNGQYIFDEYVKMQREETNAPLTPEMRAHASRLWSQMLAAIPPTPEKLTLRVDYDEDLDG